MATDFCLFLTDWEAARAHGHAVRRKRAEGIISNLQARARNGAASLEAWLGAIESRRRLLEVASGAATQAATDLEARWRPQRLDQSDGEAAAWLLAAERAHAAELVARASRWAAAVPAEAAELRRKHQALCNALAGSVLSDLRAWDASNESLGQAWQKHNERLEEASALPADQAPPDMWLSEVRYREQARAHLDLQATAERVLAESMESLVALEGSRAAFWRQISVTYGQLHGADSIGAPAIACESEGGKSPQAPGLPQAPLVQILGSCTGEEPPPPLPEMPTASGAVLHRMPVSVQTTAGLFGRGGGQWRPGATLVLTLHGYLHVFGGDAAPAAPPGGASELAAQGEGSTAPNPQAEGATPSSQEELVESAIVASVYVPMATKCVVLRRGKECTLNVAEAEVADAAPATPAPGGVAGGFRRLMGRASAAGPAPRKAFVRIDDEAEVAKLEARCHDFIRRGQGMRSSAAT